MAQFYFTPAEQVLLSKIMRLRGRIGGRSRSEAKIRAAKENGKKHVSNAEKMRRERRKLKRIASFKSGGYIADAKVVDGKLKAGRTGKRDRAFWSAVSAVGGCSRSKAKQAAARENGKKGGRPRA